MEFVIAKTGISVCILENIKLLKTEIRGAYMSGAIVVLNLIGKNLFQILFVNNHSALI